MRNYMPTLNQVSAVERISAASHQAFGAIAVSALTMGRLLMNAGATDNISVSISSGLEDAFDLLRNIAIPVAIIALGLCAFYIFTNGDKGMEKAKKIALYTVIGIGIVFLAPFIVKTVAGWFNSGDAQNAATDMFNGNAGAWAEGTAPPA